MSRIILLIAALLMFLGSAPGSRAAAPSGDHPATAVEEQEGREERLVRIDVGLKVNGGPAGDLMVHASSSGNALVDSAQLLGRLQPIISPALLQLLKQRIAGRTSVSVEELSSTQFPIRFDPRSLQIEVVIPFQYKRLQYVSVIDAQRHELGSAVKSPEKLAFGISITLAERLHHKDELRRIHRDSANLVVRGFVNLGGIEGVNLTFAGGYREGGKFFRRGTQLFHDDVGRAIRYSAGDLEPRAAGAWGVPLSVAGLGVERLYDVIQPYRNIRAAGRGALALDRPSLVDVYVNGVLHRTLPLQAGRYDLRDFPFLNGLNDVRMVVKDDTGRNEAIDLSFFADTALLEPGLSIFSAAAGFRRSHFLPAGGTNYDDQLVLSGFYQRGLAERLTIGGAAQWDKHNDLVSTQAVVGTALGLVAVEAALDRHTGERLQTALLVSYRYRASRQGGHHQLLDIDFQKKSAGFSPMQPAGAWVNRYRYDLSARYQTDLLSSTFATFGAGFSKGRSRYRDLRSFSAGLSRPFRRFTLGGNYTYRTEDRRSDHRAMVSLSVHLSRRHSARVAYDSRGGRTSLDYDLHDFERLGATTGRVSLAKDDLGQSARLEVEHIANRFRAEARHSYYEISGLASQATDLAVNFGFGYAGGQLAFGRDADLGFVIVAPHRTLAGSNLIASDGHAPGALARSGAFGPGLIPLRHAYQQDSLQVEVEKLPSGYDIGAGRLDILPGAASGYRWNIGSAASITVVGNLVGTDGAPLAYIFGTLEPLGGSEAASGQFFTNRNGRFVAQRMAPGRYAIIPSGVREPLAILVVPQEAIGTVQAGTLTARSSLP